MEIRYECKRCGKEVNAKLFKAKFKSWNGKGDYHNWLDCTECGKYIKFIGQRELDGMVRLESDGNVFLPPREGGYAETEITLGELSFKLDLILDHLGVKNG